MTRVVCGIEIKAVSQDGYHDLSVMVGELLNEIMAAITEKAFNYVESETGERAKRLIEDGKYWVFLAEDRGSESPVGFVSLYAGKGLK